MSRSIPQTLPEMVKMRKGVTRDAGRVRVYTLFGKGRIGVDSLYLICVSFKKKLKS